MTVALFDVEALATALRGVDLADRAALGAALARFRAARTPAAAAVNVLSIALFRVFQVCLPCPRTVRAARVMRPRARADPRGGRGGGGRSPRVAGAGGVWLRAVRSPWLLTRACGACAQLACLDYLARGGAATDGPVGLLAGCASPPPPPAARGA